jgi:hypothetical protein
MNTRGSDNDTKLFRSIIGFINSLLIIGGAIIALSREAGRLSPSSLIVVSVALVPTVLFIIAVRSPIPTVICGAVLLITTALGWTLYTLASVGEPLLGIYILPVFLVALGTSLWAATSDAK